MPDIRSFFGGGGGPPPSEPKTLPAKGSKSKSKPSPAKKSPAKSAAKPAAKPKKTQPRVADKEGRGRGQRLADDAPVTYGRRRTRAQADEEKEEEEEDGEEDDDDDDDDEEEDDDEDDDDDDDDEAASEASSSSSVPAARPAAAPSKARVTAAVERPMPLRNRRVGPVATSPAPARASAGKARARGPPLSPMSRFIVSAGTKPGLRGLRNLGNTCFGNVSLQALSHVRRFRTFFLEKASHVLGDDLPPVQRTALDASEEEEESAGAASARQKRRRRGLPPTPPRSRKLSRRGSADTSGERSSMALSRSIYQLMRVLWSEDDVWQTIQPNELVSAVWRHLGDVFVGFQQQDAQEFFAFLLQYLEQEFTDARAAAVAGTSLPNFITDTFAGSMQYETTCERCGGVSQTSQPFRDLRLAVPESEKVGRDVTHRSRRDGVRAVDDDDSGSDDLSLHDCFQMLMGEELLSGDSQPFCAACRARNPARRRCFFTKLPEVLVLHINRINWWLGNRAPRSAKIRRHISFDVDDVLDLASLFPGKHHARHMTHRYRLAAAIVHHGRGVQSGHYTVMCRSPENAWHEFNDERVRPIDAEAVGACQAYMLFYEAIS